MKVTVRIHDAVSGLVTAWRRSLSPNPADARALAQVYLFELKRRLAAAGGFPRETETDTTTNPPTYLCELTGGTWVRYTVTNSRMFGWVRSRDIEIIGLEERLPPPSPQGSLPA
jgi:hypothetical protein